jgi:hypothetical protein
MCHPGAFFTQLLTEFHQHGLDLKVYHGLLQIPTAETGIRVLVFSFDCLLYHPLRSKRWVRRAGKFFAPVHSATLW